MLILPNYINTQIYLSESNKLFKIYDYYHIKQKISQKAKLIIKLNDPFLSINY